MFLQNIVEGTVVPIMRILYSGIVKRDGLLFQGHLQDFVVRDIQEFSRFINEPPDQPGTGYAIDLRFFSCYPFHAIKDNPYPSNAPPATTSALFTFLNPKTTTRLRTAIRTVLQSVTVSLPKDRQTARIIPIDATFTPFRKAENIFERRIRGTSGFSNATKRKEGRNMAMVAPHSPNRPFAIR